MLTSTHSGPWERMALASFALSANISRAAVLSVVGQLSRGLFAKALRARHWVEFNTVHSEMLRNSCSSQSWHFACHM